MSRQLGAFSGLAMLLIVLNHAIHMGFEGMARYGYPPLEGWGRYFLAGLQGVGVFAVPIFLFISGAFVAYAARRVEGVSFRFIGAGLRHILIPYLVWSLIFYAAVYWLRGEQYSWFGYLKNLLVGYPFHFIPLLVFFYLLAPLLVFFSRRFGWLVLLLVAGYQLFLLNLRDPAILGLAFPDSWQILALPVLTNTMADWGIYFPLGLVFSLHMGALRPWLLRLKWVALLATLLLFVLAFLDVNGWLTLPLARYLCPLTLMLALPALERRELPAVRQLERIGKKAYGLYLTHLLVLELALFAIGVGLPALYAYPLFLFPALFLLALQLPIWLMDGVGRTPARPAYRYLFG